MKKEKIIIVDEDDNLMGFKERGTLDKKDIYRVSALWLKNSKGNILLAQRSFNKKNHPGKWGPAVAGTNDEGETYESNIVKETEEEIGITEIDFKKLIKERVEGESNCFAQWFYSRLDRELEEFVIQKEEIEQIKWFSKEELMNELKNNPDKFMPSLINAIKFLEK